MNQIQVASIVSKIASNLSSKGSHQEKLQAVYDFLVKEGFRYNLEAIKLKEIMAQIPQLEALKIRSFAALVLEDAMYREGSENDRTSKRNLIGPAQILNYAIACSGFKTKILHDNRENRFVLVAYF